MLPRNEVFKNPQGENKNCFTCGELQPCPGYYICLSHNTVSMPSKESFYLLDSFYCKEYVNGRENIRGTAKVLLHLLVSSDKPVMIGSLSIDLIGAIGALFSYSLVEIYKDIRIKAQRGNVYISNYPVKAVGIVDYASIG